MASFEKAGSGVGVDELVESYNSVGVVALVE
jgi:hypothetical protein